MRRSPSAGTRKKAAATLRDASPTTRRKRGRGSAEAGHESVDTGVNGHEGENQHEESDSFE
jgi:hypothetical protein